MLALLLLFSDKTEVWTMSSFPPFVLHKGVTWMTATKL